jgi:hypothetical protein
MGADRLLDRLHAAGIRLGCDGGTLYADVLPGVNLTPHAATITAHKPALLAALSLRERIIAAVTVEPAAFDRPAYDALWTQYRALKGENAR